ncbi:MAG: LysM peptidoglycan-binding domain-containing protein [Mobilitalea sp.]
MNRTEDRSMDQRLKEALDRTLDRTLNRTLNNTEYQKEDQFSRKRVYIMGAILLVCLITFSVLFLSKTATAEGSNDRIKLVTSVEIEKGDTLWSIASEYVTYEYSDMNEYIDEIIDSNNLPDDTIHAGNYIVVSYYANDLR